MIYMNQPRNICGGDTFMYILPPIDFEGLSADRGRRFSNSSNLAPVMTNPERSTYFARGPVEGRRSK